MRSARLRRRATTQHAPQALESAAAPDRDRRRRAGRARLGDVASASTTSRCSTSAAGPRSRRSCSSFVGVTVYTFTATPIYEAQTQILIETEDPNVVAFKEVVEEDQTTADYYQTQYNILQSRALARRTIDDAEAVGPSAASTPAGERPLQRRPIRRRRSAFVVSRLRSGRRRRGRRARRRPTRRATQSRAIDRSSRGLTVAPIRNSRLVDVKYRARRTRRWRRSIANALAKAYIEQNLEFKFMASKEATDWLGERLGEQRKEVEQAEPTLQRYREQNDAISLEDRRTSSCRSWPT